MPPYHSFLPFALAITFSTIFLTISPTEALNNGFSVELIHRDSAKSPFFNPTETSYQKTINALKRSKSRACHFYPSISTDSAQSEVSSNNGEYLMTYSVGTPPFKLLGIADTGSDLIWMQCKPCEGCYEQTAPLFDPSKSSSYRDFSCTSKQCNSLNSEQISCSGSGDEGICQYSYKYGDQSYTNGNIASETITLDSTTGRPAKLPKSVIGCGHDNGGTFNSKDSGIVGLGGGAISLISQMGSSIGGKFSYCLSPTANISSKLNFGENAVVSGAGSVSTPMVSKDPATFYYLSLEGVSVGEKRLDFVREQAKDAEEGNIIIDSGTTLTLLSGNFYSQLLQEVAAQIRATPVQDPSLPLDLCYRSTSKDFDIPIITVHFKGGDVKLNPTNTFTGVSDDLICFAFAAIDQDLGGIYGNLAQRNFLIGYDLQEKTVSFKPTECTKA